MALDPDQGVTGFELGRHEQRASRRWVTGAAALIVGCASMLAVGFLMPTKSSASTAAATSTSASAPSESKRMKLGVGQCDDDVAAAKETAPVADSKSHVAGQCGIDIAVTEAQLAPTVLLTSSVR